MEDKGRACYEYLSRNERLPNKAETLEESMVTTISAIKAARATDIVVAKENLLGGHPNVGSSRFDAAIAELTAKGTRSRQNKLFSLPPLLDMLMYMVEFDHGYFQKTNMLKKSWLTKVINIHGTVCYVSCSFLLILFFYSI